MAYMQKTTRSNIASSCRASTAGPSRRICVVPFSSTSRPSLVRGALGTALPGWIGIFITQHGVLLQRSCQAHSSQSSCSRPMSVATRAAAVADAPAAPALPYRVGHGFDLHRLAEGYKLIIGGVEIPHTKGCEAHSDGDVLLHTVTDAILGALSLPDIGQLFPDNDPTWKGASSDIFVKEAVKKMKEAGYVLGNLDCTIIAQKPKLSPHKENIRANLCKLLEAHPSVINIKAKTHEKVDSIGEERSIGCHAVIMLIRKDMA